MSGLTECGGIRPVIPAVCPCALTTSLSAVAAPCLTCTHHSSIHYTTYSTTTIPGRTATQTDSTLINTHKIEWMRWHYGGNCMYARTYLPRWVEEIVEELLTEQSKWPLHGLQQTHHIVHKEFLFQKLKVTCI